MDPKPIYTYSEKSVYLDYENVYFKFVPTSTGFYQFTGTAGADIEAILYDQYHAQIASNGSFGNFDIESYLFSGNTYYLSVRSTSYSSTNCRISVTYI